MSPRPMLREPEGIGVDGPYTGEWVSQKVTGKYSRTEYWLVGPMVNAYQYVCYQNGNRAFQSRWGREWVRSCLLSAKGLMMVKHGVQWVAVCGLCDSAPKFDPYSSKFVCKCGIQKVHEYKGKWYTCAECSRRFKSMEPEFLCPECLI